MSTATREMERRRFKRRAIKLNASLSIEAFATVPCLILDFCPSGLFLDINESTLDLSSLLHQNVSVQFSARGELGIDSFKIDLQVMRVCPSGVGLAFENIATSAYNALRNEANNQSPRPLDSPPRSSTRVNLKSIERSVRKLLDKNLPLLLEDFFHRADEELLKSAQKAESDTEKAEYIDATIGLKTSQKQLTHLFCNSFSGEAISGNNVSPATDNENKDHEESFSLVETNEFEDWLNLSSTVRKTESYCHEQLDELKQKLSIVYGVTPEQTKNPLSPEKLCDSFQKTIETNNESNKIKQLLYRVFESTLSLQLPDLYQQFDTILTQNGAPNKVSRKFTKKSHRNPNQSKQPIRSDDQHPEHSVPGQSPADFQHLQPVTTQERGSLPTSLSHEPGVSSRHEQSLAQTAGFLMNLFRENNHNTSRNSEEASNVPSGENRNGTLSDYPHYSSKELLGAISQLQKSDNKNGHQDLNKLLLETLTHSHGGEKKLSAHDKESLEISGTLFDTIFKDPTLSSNTRALLESIQLPVSALALQDPGFLNEPTHPAHRVLNQLSYLGDVLAGGENAGSNNIKELIEKLVAKITQESFDDPNIFSQVDQELTKISDPAIKSSESNIRRVVEACEGKQKMDDAKQVVRNQVDIRIAGRSVPKIVPALLDAGWRHLLVLTALRDGETSKEWQQYLAVIDQLIAWLSVQAQRSERDNHSIQELLDLVDNQLGTVCPDTFIYNKTIDELTAVLLGTGTPQVRKQVEMINIAPVIPDNENRDNKIDNECSDQLDRLQIGEWFMFSNETKELKLLKLVWISNRSRAFIFVNRKGQKELELNQQELIEQIDNGTATKIESLDVPLMDRTTSRMLQKMHDRLMLNATHDPLTGLMNQTAFEKQLHREMSQLGKSRHLLCFIEIRGLRTISSSCGLGAGEQVLKNLAGLIQENHDKKAIIAKLGEKTFAVLLKNCSTKSGEKIAHKFRDLINDFRFKWEDKSFSIGVNMGLIPFVNNSYNVAELLQKAGALCLSAKESGQNSIQTYNAKDERLKIQNNINEWAGRIDKLFSEKRLFIRCQKIAPIDPEKNRHSHYEILLGIKDEAGNVIPPDDFIPAAERCQRMPEIDRWIVRNVFNWIAQNGDQFEKIGGFSINLSGQSLNTSEFLIFLKEQLASSNVPHEKITFEITETVAAGDLTFAEKFIRQIKRFGCKFSLDDFGTGYSSYAYLKRLNVDYLKIDGVFVKDIANSETDAAMVKSMNEIGHSLGMETIAEYVENDEIKHILGEIGVDYAQGWGIQKPVLLENLGSCC